jgi:GT2 family glycosyltransferase
LKTDPKIAAVRGAQGLTYNLPISGALENYFKYIYDQETQLEAKVDSFAIGSSVFKKSAIMESGGFRAMFRFASEDTDLAAKLSRLGYKIHNLKSAVFYHTSRSTWKDIFMQYRSWGCYFKTIEKLYKQEFGNYNLVNLALNNSLYILVSMKTIFKAYRATKDIRCILLPIHSAFKRAAWTIGYIN